MRGYGESDFAQLGITLGGDLRLHRAKGCVSCNNTGYRGRAAIHELLIGSDEIKRLVQSRARVPELLAQARSEGMTTLV